ncbi:hypothetical protein [Janthinobacterium sp. UMAB-60]|uniref:hypothetical protein n=1 Tax=Janthinobacterium sp. UMAB-60 TaxID=1365365 RepID=UPI001C58A078|nr:hypothetical protein [Janthinobacterium sp. UMAB-60]
MKNFLIFLVFALNVSVVQAGKTTQIYLDNGELNYVGEISQAGNIELFELFESLDKKPAILSIRSKGGNTDSGIALGTWIHARGLTVKVMEYCFSSCANYVFTAASHKIVSNFAVIGYHGGLGSSHFGLDAEQEARFAAMPVAEQAAARTIFDDSIRQMVELKRQEERKFFALIKVNQEITTLGQAPQYVQRYGSDDRFLGWTFSVDGFAKLGVSNIRVIYPPWRAKFINSDFSVFVIDVI